MESHAEFRNEEDSYREGDSLKSGFREIFSEAWIQIETFFVRSTREEIIVELTYLESSRKMLKLNWDEQCSRMLDIFESLDLDMITSDLFIDKTYYYGALGAVIRESSLTSKNANRSLIFSTKILGHMIERANTEGDVSVEKVILLCAVSSSIRKVINFNISEHKVNINYTAEELAEIEFNTVLKVLNKDFDADMLTQVKWLMSSIDALVDQTGTLYPKLFDTYDIDVLIDSTIIAAFQSIQRVKQLPLDISQQLTNRILSVLVKRIVSQGLISGDLVSERIEKVWGHKLTQEYRDAIGLQLVHTCFMGFKGGGSVPERQSNLLIAYREFHLISDRNKYVENHSLYEDILNSVDSFFDGIDSDSCRYDLLSEMFSILENFLHQYKCEKSEVLPSSICMIGNDIFRLCSDSIIPEDEITQILYLDTISPDNIDLNSIDTISSNNKVVLKKLKTILLHE